MRGANAAVAHSAYALDHGETPLSSCAVYQRKRVKMSGMARPKIVVRSLALRRFFTACLREWT